MAEKPSIKTPFKDAVGPRCVGEKGGSTKKYRQIGRALVTAFLLTLVVKGVVKGTVGAAKGTAKATVAVSVAVAKAAVWVVK